MTPKLIIHENRLADVIDVRMNDGDTHSYCSYYVRYRADETERWVAKFQVRELTASEKLVLGLRERVRGK